MLCYDCYYITVLVLCQWSGQKNFHFMETSLRPFQAYHIFDHSAGYAEEISLDIRENEWYHLIYGAVRQR